MKVPFVVSFSLAGWLWLMLYLILGDGILGGIAFWLSSTCAFIAFVIAFDDLCAHIAKHLGEHHK